MRASGVIYTVKKHGENAGKQKTHGVRNKTCGYRQKTHGVRNKAYGLYLPLNFIAKGRLTFRQAFSTLKCYVMAGRRGIL